jgi:hypothetical protein
VIINKTILLTILMSVGLLNSCKNKDEHGCLDYTATNYNDNAQIDNNSCCYTCYTVFNTPVDTIGSYCGREILELEENGFTYENIHVWVNQFNEFVLPFTPNSIPAYNWEGLPIIMDLRMNVDCY